MDKEEVKLMSVTAVDIQQLEQFADRIFANVGIDVEFTKHFKDRVNSCLLYTSPSPRDRQKSRMPSSA